MAVYAGNYMFRPSCFNRYLLRDTFKTYGEKLQVFCLLQLDFLVI
jgi:hypothetical protein